METTKLEEAFKPHIDKCGLIVEKPWEGGDTACEHFFALVVLRWLSIDKFLDGINLLNAYHNASKQLLNLPSGLWRRHCAKRPGTTKGIDNYWASEWNRGTRDNGTSLFIATIEFGDRKSFFAMYDGFKRRKWFCGNTFPRNVYARKEDHKKYAPHWRQPHDPSPTLPDSAVMLKAIAYRSQYVQKNTWLWDIICCLIPAVLIRRVVKADENDGNHLNAWLRINFCVRRRPTWISKLALKILPKDIELDLEFGEKSFNPPMHLLVDEYQKQRTWNL